MLRLMQRGEPLPIPGSTGGRPWRPSSAMDARLDATCEECGSTFASDSSGMSALCPECAHHLHGYPACSHHFVAGRCEKCGWDGSVSPYVASLTGRGRTFR